jgi:hypothetical protein
MPLAGLQLGTPERARVETLQQISLANYKEECFQSTGKREKIDFCDHSEDKSHLQVYHAPSEKNWDLFELKRKKRSPTQADIAYYADRKKLIETSQELIGQHVNRRIQLFFQQTILCYNTPFFYDAEGAEDQIGVGSEVRLSPEVTHKTQAAHSSTLPCLYAYPKDANGQIDRSKRFVFLKYSNFYNQHNATIELPIEVNQADTRLDGKSGEEKLRDAALSITNRVAQAHMKPTKATKEFLERFEENLNQLINTLAENDLRRDVFQIYLVEVCGVRAEINQSKELFDQILGVKNISESEKILRNVVYKSRFDMIQKAELIESQIAKRIFEAEKATLGSKISSLKSVDYRVRYILLKGASKDRERKCYEKFFCTSLEQLQSTIKNKQEKFRRVENAVGQFETKYQTQINDLRRDLRVLFRNLETLEFEYRSKFFRGLRWDYKQWYQREFVEAFKVKHPDEPMSQPMVSRLEQPSRLKPGEGIYATPECQRRKEMDIGKAEKIASTFDIDVGLFLPGLLTSD